jgi:acid phosphatase (class A)
MKYRMLFLVVLLDLCLNSGCAKFSDLNQAEPRTDPHAGYLATATLPDSAALLPPPPLAGSIAQSRDEEVSQMMLPLHGTPRWNLAAEDANTEFPEAAGIFSCALNAPLTEKDTPHLYLLLSRTLADAGASTDQAKIKYHRKRPFMVNNQSTCTPNLEKYMISSGSYPSGHSTAGWAWALILSEIAPERTDAVLARGLAFGESRLVCNAHWYSDVVAGRVMGAATVARLHADPVFRADLEAAKAEFASLSRRGLKPQRDCAGEAAALVPSPIKASH